MRLIRCSELSPYLSLDYPKLIVYTICMDRYKTFAQFLNHFKDEETCRAYFEKIRFAQGEYCPQCNHSKINRYTNSKRMRCAKCKMDFQIITKTIFSETKAPLQKWFIAIYLLSTSKKGISSIELANKVGVTQKTTWFMDHRIRQALKENNGEYAKAGGINSKSIENFWAVLKRGCYGTYHTKCKKQLQKNVDEFLFRFNNRATNLTDRFAEVVAGISGREKLLYKSLVA